MSGEPLKSGGFVQRNGAMLVAIASLFLTIVVQICGFSYYAGQFRAESAALAERVRKIETEGMPQATRQIVEWQTQQIAELKSDSRTQTQAVVRIDQQMITQSMKLDTVLDRVKAIGTSK